jgi:dipeptidyl aminopeptidase/acylaminoacyl peptidase
MKRKPIGTQDLYKLKFLREIALSPCGKKVAYTVEWMDRKKNKYFSNLYVVTENGKIHHFIRGNKNIRLPKWSPDGKFISFLRTEIMKNESKQNIWMIPVSGGEAYAVTDAKGMFGGYEWTPDSKHIVCQFAVKKEDKERVPEKGKPPLYHYVKKAWYKFDGTGMLPEEKMHIWRVSVNSGKMKQLTSGKNGDAEPKVSPDGKNVVFITNRNVNFEEKMLYQDIYIVDINGKKERRIKTPAGPKGQPTFSPDGKSIVYIGRTYPEQFVGWRTLYLWSVSVKGGKAVNLTKSLDRTVPGYIIDDMGHYAQTSPIFSKDGKFLYYHIADNGDQKLYGIDIKNKKIIKLWGDKEVIYAYDHDGGDTFAMAISNPSNPGDLYLVKSGKLKRLTDLNRNFIRNHRLSEPEDFWFKGDKGDKIQGWLIKPPRFNKKKKYPLIVQIHGGPHAAYGNSMFHEFQLLAANGYIVFYCNPHGSVGYGEKFAKDLHNQWGIPDTKDIMKAVRSLTRRKYIDRRNMGVMGGSYGGFMTNWIIGHTDVFRVAVTMRSVVNMLSFFSTDFGFSLHKEFRGHLWEKNNLQFYWNMSPLKYANRIKTPLLIIHSEQDHRCPISQGEELYVALKILKKEVEMVRFPLEPHGLSRHGSPRRREKRLDFIVQFVDRYLKK